MDIEETRRKAESGLCPAQAHLGHLYLTGQGVEQDYVEAFRWIKAAADQGAFTPVAMLGRMYEEGLGVERDLAEAVRLYKDAALRGNLGAALDLARRYRFDTDVAIDEREAATWYAVTAVLSDDETDLQYSEASQFLFQSAETIDTLIRMLNSTTDRRLRYYGALAIGQLNIVEALPALYAAAEDAEVREWVAEAFGYVTYWKRDVAPKKAAITGLLLRLMDDQDENVRCSAANSISNGRHNNRKTRERLRKAIGDPCDRVQQVAVLGLARFGDREILPWLETKLVSNDIAPHHIYAAEAIGDSSLLPAVRVGVERLTQTMWGREELEHGAAILEALATMEQAANRP